MLISHMQFKQTRYNHSLCLINLDSAFTQVTVALFTEPEVVLMKIMWYDWQLQTYDMEMNFLFSTNPQFGNNTLFYIMNAFTKEELNTHWWVLLSLEMRAAY